MTEWERMSIMVEGYKKQYPVGTRVLLLHMGDDPRPIEDNTRGTVKVVDDMGTLHCDFDNGRQLGIVPGEDSFRTRPLGRAPHWQCGGHRFDPDRLHHIERLQTKSLQSFIF